MKAQLQLPVPPRYVRRNWKESILLNPKTRRERKRRARIVRAMKDQMK